MNKLEKFESKFIPEPMSGCWLWLSNVMDKGYGLFWHNKKYSRAHRAAWELYKGPILNNLHVLHKCDNRLCVNPDHLFLGTNMDNIKDRDLKNRQSKGVHRWNCKLSEEDIPLIRKLAIAGDLTQKEIGKIFGVSATKISQIKLRKNWRHVL